MPIRNGEQKPAKDLSSFLGNQKNKTMCNLMNSTLRLTDLQNVLQDDQFIYFANLDLTAIKILHHSLFKKPWTTDHEEADSKMFVFSEHQMNHYDFDHIIISSPETDISVIVSYQFATNLSSLSKLWFKTRVGSKRKGWYVVTHETTEEFVSTMLSIILVFHSIT